MTLTPEKLAELRRLHEAAAKEWYAYADRTGRPSKLESANGRVCTFHPTDANRDVDAALIVAMRNALPSLLSAAEERDALRKRVEELEGMLRCTLREADARIANDPEWWAQVDTAEALLTPKGAGDE